ncbi:MAG: thioredoxin fold domain-containing protein [Campylobacterota bacterium]|nr:thioredoxin fold domain-containing protein [Campylobacterota bacterium]
MKKSILVMGLLFVMLAINLNAEVIKLDAKKLKEIKSNTKALQKSAISVIDGIDKDSVYFLKLASKTKRGTRVITAFLDKKTGAVYFGNGYDKEGNQIQFPKNVKLIKDGISFSYGTGSKEIYLVTDPECSYCKKFEKAAEGKLEEYTVHVIFYPLSFHKKAPAMIEWIMQGKDDAQKKERLTQITLHNSVEYKALIKNDKKPFAYSTDTKIAIDNAMKAVRELGTRGTPSTYSANFNKVPWSSLVNKNTKPLKK